MREQRKNILRMAAVLGLVLTVASDAAAASRSQPVRPELVHDRLEIGPVAGLTTAWHPAPVRTAIPLGAAIELRLAAPPGFDVAWSGATEGSRSRFFSTASRHFAVEGAEEVRVTRVGPFGETETLAIDFEVLRLQPSTLSVTGLFVGRIGVLADPFLLDPFSPAASAAQHFEAPSIALLRQDDQGVYRTSINRVLTVEAEPVTPSAFAPLVEWRLDGVPLRHLGAALRLELFTAGAHLLAAGPPADESETHLSTYLVRIVSHPPVMPILEGEPITFVAETEPPGFEDEVTWTAAAGSGFAEPWTGQGRELTVRFFGIGDDPRHLGVRADNARVHGRVGEAAAGLDFSPLACRYTAGAGLAEPILDEIATRFCQGGLAIPRSGCESGTVGCFSCCQDNLRECLFLSCLYTAGDGLRISGRPGLDVGSGCELDGGVVLGCLLANDFCHHDCIDLIVPPIDLGGGG